MDVQARVTKLLDRHPDVVQVELVGSRARGDATPLSDWDLLIHTTDAPALSRELPTLVSSLEPLGSKDLRGRREVVQKSTSGASLSDGS